MLHYDARRIQTETLGMESGLALYNALVRINVPHETARDVVSALERDVGASVTRGDIDSLHGATSALRDGLEDLKADFKVLRADLEGLKIDMRGLRADLAELKTEMKTLRTDMTASVEPLREEMRHSEPRMTVRLGGLMVAGLGIMTTFLALVHR